MLSADRLASYVKQAGYPAGKLGGVTPAQARRLKHKQLSRKNHPHAYISDWTCERCKPGWMPARLRRHLEQQA